MVFRLAKDGGSDVRDNNAAWVAGPSRICFVGPVFLTHQRSRSDIHSFSGSCSLLCYSPAAFFSP